MCMNERIWGAIVGILLLLAAGCLAPVSSMHEEGNELDVIVKTLDNRILQVTTNIERLGKQMTVLNQAPDTADPVLRELHRLDLDGWQLHQQQWILQREHLLVTKEQLRRVQEAPEEKLLLMAQWTKQRQQYETVLEGLRQQRLALERKYFQTETQLVERYLH